MRTTAIAPTGVEQTFSPDEVIVSKTDLQGRITYANQVFLRVAGYVEDEVIGQPHNMIRHPDMPRAIFELLWSRIQAGDEVFAYVVNLCKNGDHYWTFAHVTPTVDATGRIRGYHSNRRRPRAAAVQRIQDLYQHLLVAERAAGSGPRAVAAGDALLQQHLTEEGISYDELVFSL